MLQVLRVYYRPVLTARQASAASMGMHVCASGHGLTVRSCLQAPPERVCRHPHRQGVRERFQNPMDCATLCMAALGVDGVRTPAYKQGLLSGSVPGRVHGKHTCEVDAQGSPCQMLDCLMLSTASLLPQHRLLPSAVYKAYRAVAIAFAEPYV